MLTAPFVAGIAAVVVDPAAVPIVAVAVVVVAATSRASAIAWCNLSSAAKRRVVARESRVTTARSVAVR